MTWTCVVIPVGPMWSQRALRHAHEALARSRVATRFVGEVLPAAAAHVERAVMRLSPPSPVGRLRQQWGRSREHPPLGWRH